LNIPLSGFPFLSFSTLFYLFFSVSIDLKILDKKIILLKFGGLKMPKKEEEQTLEDDEDLEDSDKESDDDVSSDDDDYF
jgi:hypothetical protein